MKPLISVIIPTYNNASTLEAALRSIRTQTYEHIEMLVVDDASSDDTYAVAQSIAASDTRVRVISAPDDPHRFDTTLKRNINAGYSARNAGFAEVRGELITFQDADDVSLLNRIEIQEYLLTKFRATHIVTSFLPFDKRLFDTRSNVPVEEIVPTLGPMELYRLSQRTKSIVAKVSPALNRAVPFHVKRQRLLNKLFFGSLASYPGAGNSPLFHRDVIEKVRFRKLAERIWPSFMGRGADRDFNFQVAETFKNSYYFDVPLYLWDSHQ